MANWGALMGLGEGLQQFGGSVFKSKFLDKLKEEEVLRKEKRDEAKTAAKIDKQNYIQKDGVWYEQDVNPNGKVIDERLAPMNKVEEFNRKTEEGKAQAKEDALRLRTLEQTLSLNERKLADYDTDKALDRRLREAQIGAENRQYTPYSRGGGSTRPVFSLDGSTVTQKEAEKYMADEMAEGGGTPAPLAKYLGRAAVRRGAAGKDFKYEEAPEYANATPETKAGADKITLAMEAMAKDILAGKVSMEEAEQYWNEKGLPQVGKAMPNMIKVIRGR